MNSQLIIMPEWAETDRRDNKICVNDNQVAVFIHFHYLDTLERYFQYLDLIPNTVSIYITTCDSKVEYEIQEYALAHNHKKIEIILKKNRGRDISSFLVVLRKK